MAGTGKVKDACAVHAQTFKIGTKMALAREVAGKYLGRLSPALANGAAKVVIFIYIFIEINVIRLVHNSLNNVDSWYEM